MNFRNETYNGAPFRWTGAWRIPASGVLEFDYVATGTTKYVSHIFVKRNLEKKQETYAIHLDGPVCILRRSLFT